MQSICQWRQRLHEVFLVPAGVLVALLALGCASSERAEPRTPVVPEAPATPDPPAPGVPAPSEPTLCVRAGATCFRTFEAACEALRCPEERCIKRSFTREVHCSDEPVHPSAIPESLEEPRSTQ